MAATAVVGVPGWTGGGAGSGQRRFGADLPAVARCVEDECHLAGRGTGTGAASAARDAPSAPSTTGVADLTPHHPPLEPRRLTGERAIEGPYPLHVVLVRDSRLVAAIEHRRLQSQRDLDGPDQRHAEDPLDIAEVVREGAGLPGGFARNCWLGLVGPRAACLGETHEVQAEAIGPVDVGLC